MNIAIITFDEFTDIDVFLMWDLLNRVKVPGWKVKLLGDHTHHTSVAGLTIPMHGKIEDARYADAVLITSGPGTRKKIKDEQFLNTLQSSLELQPNTPARGHLGVPLIGSMCSGALILAKLGLLNGKNATTYPTSKTLLESMGINVVDRPFVQEGNIATAAGCLAALDLVGWVVETLVSRTVREEILKSIQPVG